MPFSLKQIEHVPRMGWVTTASPAVPLAGLATELGLAGLWVKRDDEIEAFGGGNKVRKLDYLVAEDRYQNASHWHSSGALGSSQLVIGSRVAATLGKNFTAHACNQPESSGVRENFTETQARASRVRRYHSRATMALRRPQLVTLDHFRGDAIIPPGATSPAGSAGFVRAGLELAAQLASGVMPCPDRIYVALGSGGTAIGLAVGLAMAGLKTPVHAISVVEPIFVCRPRIEMIFYGLLHWLRKHRVGVSRRLRPNLIVDTSEVGPGYAHTTEASQRACARLLPHDLPLEETYTGKAMAALLRDAHSLPGQTLLFWHTCMHARLPGG